MKLPDWKRPLSSYFRRPKPEPVLYEWHARQFGPKFEWFSPVHLRILEGALKGEEFELTSDVQAATASAMLYYYGQCIGQTFIERDPPGKGVIFWDTGVREEFRRKGLAAIMTRHIFRILLNAQETATFKIRMVRLLKPGDKDVELQNMGMGVIANRLGFTPELDIERILQPGNITGIEIIPTKGDYPPAFKIVVNTFPLVLIAFILDPDTLKPVDDFRTYVEVSRDQSVVHDWVRRGLIVISNGNYWLREGGVDRFVDCIASSSEEGQEFRRKVIGL